MLYISYFEGTVIILTFLINRLMFAWSPTVFQPGSFNTKGHFVLRDLRVDLFTCPHPLSSTCRFFSMIKELPVWSRVLYS